MQSRWKWIIGIAGAVFLLAIFSLPMLAWGFGWGGYGMMSGWGWRTPMHGGWMPMMWGGFGWMGVGMLLSGLIQLGLLVLIVLGIVWLARAIAHQNHEGK